MRISNKIEYVKQLVAEDKIEESIDLLDGLDTSKIFKENLIALKGRYNNLKYIDRMNMISFSEYRIERNKLISNLLNLIDSIKEKSTSKEISFFEQLLSIPRAFFR